MNSPNQSGRLAIPPEISRDRPVVRLSKSRIAAFEHCEKRAWLGFHRRGLAVIDPATEYIFAIGHRFGELAREQIPNGILLDTDPQRIDDPIIKETQQLIGGDWTKRASDELARLLGHADWRVRLEAQFTLAERGAASVPLLVSMRLPHSLADLRRIRSHFCQ